MPSPNQTRFNLRIKRAPGRPPLPKSRRKRWHSRRPDFDGDRYPVLITLKLREDLPRLRDKGALKFVRRAMKRSRGYGLNLVHYSILQNHLHLLIESSGKDSLTTQMKSLAITLARNLNKLWEREGALFDDRYHSEILRNPTRTKNALGYVLTNEWRHAGRRGRIRLGRYSTARIFENWELILGEMWRRFVDFPEDLMDPHASILREIQNSTDPPRTWLLETGWKMSARGSAAREGSATRSA